MSTVVSVKPAPGKHPPTPRVSNPYGHFTLDGREFRITNVRTPRPWVNIVANPRIGLAVSHTGSGFTWIDNSQLAVITRWEQDLARDNSGKFLYVRDADSGRLWSLSPAPVWAVLDAYECRHGLGYSTFVTEFDGIQAQWTVFCHAVDTVELWRVELGNRSNRPRRLEVCAFLEWCCGVAPSPRREFHKLFLETDFEPQRRAIFARNHMWEVPSERYGHWNTDFPYVSALACTEPLLSAQGDKAAFVGRYGDLRAPEALQQDVWKPGFGRHEDPIAALRCGIVLPPGQRRQLGFALVVAESRAAVEKTLDQIVRVDVMDRALEEVQASWRARLATQRVETPEPSLNYLTNDWLRYQAISGRLWGRCGYYQQSGAYGFRDQLQDAQVWLPIEPARCRQQINLHAAHQFADGSVYHWWHPLTEQGHVTRTSDDLLWLAFVTANYIKETGDLGILQDATPFLDAAAEPRGGRGERPTFPLIEHVLRTFQRVFERTSPRGLPYIGAGDWNDGLSAAGLQERGESIWLAHFLVGLLADWAEIYRRIGTQARGREGTEGPRHEGTNARRHAGTQARRHAGTQGATAASAVNGGSSGGTAVPAVDRPWNQLAAEFAQRRAALITAINEHAWDGQWYIRATLDDGSKLGSAKNRVAKIFLNAQTWAVLNDVAPPDRAAQCMAAVRRHLVTDAGALLLAPAFDTPLPEVGYLTRYAPGLRENGGVYTHAATWAIAAACKMRDHELVGRLLTAINPALKEPERYWAEPYVLPGNVDGPDSPHHGRAGWTWYTGSAQWLHRVVTEWVLGVRPEWDGLRIDPCLPPGWNRVSMMRSYRGHTHRIQIDRATDLPVGVDAEVVLDGKPLETKLIAPPTSAGKEHIVRVRSR